MTSGFYDRDDRDDIRQKMDRAEHWIDAQPEDPPLDHPDAIHVIEGGISFLAPGPIPDPSFPLAAGPLMIGEPHDRGPVEMTDRRLATCTFVYAARTGGPTPQAAVLATFLEEARMNMDLSLWSIWRSVLGMELFSMSMANVRLAMRTRHPGIRNGLEELRRAPSGDPEIDGVDYVRGEQPSTGLKADSKEAVSPAWVVARHAVAELHAPIVYLATPFISPGGGYLFAVHPLETLSSWGLVSFDHNGTARQAGVRFFSWELLSCRDPDRGGALVLPRQTFPLMGHFARRKIYGIASAARRVGEGMRNGVLSLGEPGRLRRAADYIGAWVDLVRNGRILAREVVRLLLALASLAAVVTYLIAAVFS